MGVLLRLVLEVMFPEGRANEIGVLKGSPNRPRSISTYMMGLGLLLIIGGLYVHGLVILSGGLLFVIGFILAIVEAIFGK